MDISDDRKNYIYSFIPNEVKKLLNPYKIHGKCNENQKNEIIDLYCKIGPCKWLYTYSFLFLEDEKKVYLLGSEDENTTSCEICKFVTHISKAKGKWEKSFI